MDINPTKELPKKEKIMKNLDIYNKWSEFINKYKKYFPNNQTTSILLPDLPEDIKEYINNLDSLLKEITNLPKKPSKKSTIVKPKDNTSHNNKSKTLTKSDYQELSNKMTIQKSSTTKEMFNKNNNLWYEYHNARDISFTGYDNQDDIPINKIIKYLDTRTKHKLKILDLGCGRNLIKQHFKENSKFDITGYDYVSYNGSTECDISNLPDEDESIKICIYSQSLMGFNWKDYLLEGHRVLEYNGEMIISENRDRYDGIKNYLQELNMQIISDDYVETNRWFVINAIKR
jgi:hypothetical protein